MPSLVLEIPEPYESVTRNVNMDVIRTVMRNTQMPQDTIISYPGDAENQPIQGSRLTDTEDPSRFSHTNKVSIESREEFLENDLITMTVRYPDSQPFFADPKLNLLLRPVYSRTETTLSFTYRARTKQEAERWRNQVRRTLDMYRRENTTEIHYQYGFHVAQKVILTEIFKLRERVAPYGDTLQQYLREHFTENVTTLTTMAGTQPTLAVKEKQINVLGWFDFTIPPEESKEPEGSVWTITFDYKFNWDKPIAVVMDYPLVIHNQIIPQKFRSLNTPYQLDLTEHYEGLQRQRYDTLIRQKPSHARQIDGVIVPNYDEWYPASVPLSTSSLYTGLILVDPDDPTYVVSLKDLGDYQLRPEILAWCNEHRRWLTVPGESPIQITFYIGDTFFGAPQIYVDEDLVVRTNQPLSLRGYYHIRIAILNDLALLSDNGQKRFRNAPVFCQSILLTLDPTLRKAGLLPEPVAGKLIPKLPYLKAIAQIKTTNPMYKSKKEVVRLHVGQFLINTGRPANATATH